MRQIQTALLASAFAFAVTAASAQSLEGTARLHFTTAPGVSNFSENKSGANTPLRGVAPVVWVDDTPIKADRRHRRPQR